MFKFCRNLRTPSSSFSYFLLLALLLLLIVSPNLTEVFKCLGNWVSSGRTVCVDDYGATGDGVTDDTQAFKHAWEGACSMSSRSILKIPSGKTYLVGPINFGGPCRSKMTLMVTGTITAPKEPKVWNGFNPRKWLYFHGVDNLVVKGGGTINGMGEKWWARSCKVDRKNPCGHAPTAITFHKCNNLSMRNLVVRNSQQDHLTFSSCHGVKVSHLKVFAPVDSPNTDGIHISASSRIEVKNTIIGTGDDCISIVSNSSRIRIRNVTCGPGHGISIGSLGKYNCSDGVDDVLVDGAFISNTENGLRIKTWQGSSGSVRNIDFRNVWMNNVSNPIIIDQYYCDSISSCTNQTLSIKVEKVSFRDIQGTSATPEAIRFACSDSCPCKEISLSNIQLYYTGGNTSSYCWSAFGFSSGRVYPHPCFPYDDNFIKEKVLQAATVLSFVR